MAKSKKIDKDMGFRLKKARLDQKLTYDELSEKSGVSSRYIKEIENHGNVPSLEKLGQLIRALHISADPFFYPAAPTDNLDYQRLLVYLSECTDDQITTRYMDCGNACNDDIGNQIFSSFTHNKEICAPPSEPRGSQTV